LKQIGLALHNYHDTYKTFPPAIQIGPKKIPHSWRVAILPYLNKGDTLYHRYRLDEPWDSAHNKSLLQEMPESYRSPGATPTATTTNYFGFMPAKPAAKADPRMTPALYGSGYTRLAEILDGIANSILVVEAKLDIPWTE